VRSPDPGIPPHRDRHRWSFQLWDIQRLLDVPCPSEFPWGQRPLYRIPEPGTGVAGPVGRGHHLRSQFPLKIRQLQGPQYCHWVQGLLYHSADVVNTVLDAVGGFVDGWWVAAADFDG